MNNSFYSVRFVVVVFMVCLSIFVCPSIQAEPDSVLRISSFTYHTVLCSTTGDSIIAVTNPYSYYSDTQKNTQPIVKVKVIEGMSGKVLRAYDLKTRYKTPKTFSFTPLLQLHLIHGNPILIHQSAATTLSILNAYTNQKMHDVVFPSAIRELDISPHGLYSIVVSDSNTLYLVDNIAGTIMTTRRYSKLSQVNCFTVWSNNDSLLCLRSSIIQGGRENVLSYDFFDSKKATFIPIDTSFNYNNLVSSSWNSAFERLLYHDESTLHLVTPTMTSRDSITLPNWVVDARWSSPYSTSICAITLDSGISIINAQSKQVIRQISTGKITDYKWNPDYSLLAYLQNKTLHLIKTETGEEIHSTVLSDSMNSIVPLQWLNNSHILAVGVYIMNARTGVCFGTDYPTLYQAQNSDICYTTEGRGFALYDVESGKKGRAFPTDELVYLPVSISFSPNGKKLVSASPYVQIWDASTGAAVHWHSYSDVSSARWSTDSTRIFLGISPLNKKRTYTIVDATSLDSVYSIAANEYVFSFSTNGQYFVTQSSDSTIWVRNLANGAVVASYKPVKKQRMNAAVLNWNNTFLALSSDENLYLVDLSNQKLLRTITAESQLVYNPVFSQRGNYLAYHTRGVGNSVHIVRPHDNYAVDFETPCTALNPLALKYFSGAFSKDESRYNAWGCGFVIHEFIIPDRNLLNTNIAEEMSLSPRLTHYYTISQPSRQISIFAHPGSRLILSAKVQIQLEKDSIPEAVWNAPADKLALIEPAKNILILQPDALIDTTPVTVEDEFIQATDTSLLLYPNPASGLVHITAGGAMMKSIRIVNLLGLELQQIHPYQPTATLSTTSLNTGSYLLTVELEGGTSLYRKLVIQE